MTTYFDKARREVDDIQSLAESEQWEALEALETRVVRDVTVSAELPDFPVLYRDAIDTAVTRWGFVSIEDRAYRPDLENGGQYALRLGNLVSALHSIFHGLATQHDYSDDPLYPQVLLLEKAAERRMELLRKRDTEPGTPEE